MVIKQNLKIVVLNFFFSRLNIRVGLSNLNLIFFLTKGGLHQGTFSPQLSLVTAGTPTLTINSFSSPNTQASVVPTNGGLLVQEYQPGEPNNQIAVCPSSTSGSSSIPTATAACTVSTVIVQGAQTGSTFVQSTMKKRESFVTAQAAAQTSIKLENKTTRQSCICKSTNVNSSGNNLKPLLILIVEYEPLARLKLYIHDGRYDCTSRSR